MNAALQLVDEHGRKYLKDDERQRFIAAPAHVKKSADQTFVLTIAHTGARVSEVLVISLDRLAHDPGELLERGLRALAGPHCWLPRGPSLIAVSRCGACSASTGVVP